MTTPDRPEDPEGSSPLTRGKHGCRGRSLVGLRLIPTHAGKTAHEPYCPCTSRAHPHSRGENPGLLGGAPDGQGSSPLTRGKLFVCRFACGAARLIPTHAGKTRSMLFTPHRLRAHPHSRGENEANPSQRGLTTGSSPLTRGKRLYARKDRASMGLIPTHAGKTRGRPRRPSGSGAHPHSRGENAACDDDRFPGRGSSPLTRGKPIGPRT